MSVLPHPVTARPCPLRHHDDDPVLAAGGMHRSTRAAVGVLLVLAILNAAFLYFLPARAASGYAWAIRPPISAAFLGAGYLAGVVATALAVLAARHWRSIQPLAVALVTLSVGLLAATLLHTDRFRWGYPPTWAWTGVYAMAPTGVVTWLDASARTRSGPRSPTRGFGCCAGCPWSSAPRCWPARPRCSRSPGIWDASGRGR